jgi:hypothetical protein
MLIPSGLKVRFAGPALLWLKVQALMKGLR